MPFESTIASLRICSASSHTLLSQGIAERSLVQFPVKRDYKAVRQTRIETYNGSLVMFNGLFRLLFILVESSGADK